MSDLNKNQTWLRRKILNFLGAVDLASHDDYVRELKGKCESFANSHLVVKSAVVLNTGVGMYNSDCECDVVVIGSKVDISNCRVYGGKLLIAPWVGGFSFSNLQLFPKEDK